MTTPAPTRADVEALFDADRPGNRRLWVLLATPAGWRLVFDPPSPPRGHR